LCKTDNIKVEYPIGLLLRLCDKTVKCNYLAITFIEGFTMNSELGNTLSEVVRNQLQALQPKRTQKWLASELRMTEAELSKRLKEQKPMREDEVVHLSEILRLPLPRFLLLASIARCNARKQDSADKDNRQEMERFATAGNAYKELLKSIKPVAMPLSCRSHNYISLEDFPNMVAGPWTVIVGDRRESPVKGIGDIAGLSVASSDFMFLHKLPLPWGTTVVRSDKTLLIAKESSLSELMRNNLLIIGSPAVSLGTRAILRDVGASFMFNISSDAYDREKKIYEEVGGSTHRDTLEKIISKKVGELRSLMATFRKNGFVDPIDYDGIRGRAIAKDEDYGMIALARNPWSEKHIVCICAGVHGGGTAGALQLLASPNNFVNRPWGGVFRVNMSDQVSWETRFEHLAPEFETHPYDPHKYSSEISKLIHRVDVLANSSNKDEEVKKSELSKDMLILVQQLAKWLTNAD